MAIPASYTQLALDCTYDDCSTRIRRAIVKRLRRSMSDSLRIQSVADDLASDVWCTLCDRLHNGRLTLSGDPEADVVQLRKYALSLVSYVVADYWRTLIRSEQREGAPGLRDALIESAVSGWNDERLPRYQLLTADPEELSAELPARCVDIALYIGWIDPNVSEVMLADLLGVSESTITRRKRELREHLAQRMVAQTVCSALDSLLIDNTADPLLAALAAD